ncbi:MAG: hypothetical protein RLZZ387_2268 [Chloroflexota bacterium]
MAEHAQPTPKRRIRPETSAWITLLTFFVVFCTLVAGAGWWGWTYYSTAMIPRGGGLLRGHVNAGVTLQARGQLAPESLERPPADRDPCLGQQDVCQYVDEGYHIRTKREAGYGPVASLVLPDQTHIQLWAHPTGADLGVEKYRVTRWTDRRQEVVIRHTSGYARYDIANNQPYHDVYYTVETDVGVRIKLAPGGSYSINVPNTEPGHLAPTTRGKSPLLVEVAARRGSAVVESGEQRVMMDETELVQVASGGAIEGPTEASWDLIADGDFHLYQAQGRYLPGSGSLTWEQFWDPVAGDMTTAEQNGRFHVVETCRPETPDLCTPANQILVGQIRRDGDQQRPFANGIQQQLDADVSEFTSLRFSAWVRVLVQSVPEAGIAGSECPVLITIKYKPTSPTDQEQQRLLCVYVDQDNSPSTQATGEFLYRPVPQFQWYRLDVELRDDAILRQARYLQLIRIEARGHDYLSEITDISLTGRQ